MLWRIEKPYLHKDEIELPSDRSTGLVFAAVAAIVAAIWYSSANVFWPAAMICAAFASTALLVPSVLGPLNRAWFKVGMLMNKIVSPVVMFVLFAIVIVPAGIIMRIFRDPLQSKRDVTASSYWRSRDTEIDSRSSMKDQF